MAKTKKGSTELASKMHWRLIWKMENSKVDRLETNWPSSKPIVVCIWQGHWAYRSLFAQLPTVFYHLLERGLFISFLIRFCVVLPVLGVGGIIVLAQLSAGFAADRSGQNVKPLFNLDSTAVSRRSGLLRGL